jgi:hypothetical protein
MGLTHTRLAYSLLEAVTARPVQDTRAIALFYSMLSGHAKQVKDDQLLYDIYNAACKTNPSLGGDSTSILDTFFWENVLNLQWVRHFILFPCIEDTQISSICCAYGMGVNIDALRSSSTLLRSSNGLSWYVPPFALYHITLPHYINTGCLSWHQSLAGSGRNLSCNITILISQFDATTFIQRVCIIFLRCPKDASGRKVAHRNDPKPDESGSAISPSHLCSSPTQRWLVYSCASIYVVDLNRIYGLYATRPSFSKAVFTLMSSLRKPSTLTDANAVYMPKIAIVTCEQRLAAVESTEQLLQLFQELRISHSADLLITSLLVCLAEKNQR